MTLDTQSAIIVIGLGLLGYVAYKKFRFFGGMVYMATGYFLMSLDTTTLARGGGVLIILTGVLFLILDVIGYIAKKIDQGRKKR